MAFRFAVGDRVSSAFGIDSETFYGTVVRLERGVPIVVFDRRPNEERKTRKANCYPITPELVATLAARAPSDLTDHQRDLLAQNRMLLPEVN